MAEYIFKPSNILTFETVQADNQRLLKLLEKQNEVTEIRFDMSQVGHCDSTGLALLIEAKRLCNQNQISFVMENISESLSGLAMFCGVDTVLL